MRKLRLIDRPMFKAQFQLEHSPWIGLIWHRTELCFHLMIAVIPFLPLHVTITRRAWANAWAYRRKVQRAERETNRTD